MKYSEAILEKRYGSIVRLPLGIAPRQETITFFEDTGKFKNTSSLDPAAGIIQNIEGGQKISNGDLYVQAIGVLATPILGVIDQVDAAEQLQIALISFSVLGNLQFNQAQTEIVSIMGQEMLHQELNIVTVLSTTGAVRQVFPTIGKIKPLNQPRLLMRDQTFSFDYLTFIESNVALGATAFLYVGGYVLGRFFPGTIRDYPEVALTLGIRTDELPSQ